MTTQPIKTIPKPTDDQPPTPVSTLLCMLLDRSGSMEAIKSDVNGGFDAFIAAQRALGGSCVVTLNQFDTEFECVYRLRDIADVPPLALAPRGATALLDAIGRTVADLQHDLEALPEKRRPEKVIVVILTDGYENSSVEWSPAAVKALIEAKQPAWDFVFIGADMDAVAEAAKLGVSADASMRNTATSESQWGTFNALSTATARSRLSGDAFAYIPEERAQSMGESSDGD